MKYLLLPLFVISLLFTAPAQAQTVTGLEGFTIFLDPGHSQKENEGLYNYSEAEKMLRVGLQLREMLLTQTDIDTVYMSRVNDSQSVTLSQRTDRANQLAPDFYYSLHSDAGSSSANSTLFLYGGWKRNGQIIEKYPPGGKDMGDILNVNLPSAMRIPTRGNYADRTFYNQNVNNQWPYLHVNRETDMASLLSESGFHTNPTQQQRNLNAEWKRLEAQAHLWTIIEYSGATERPTVGIATGYITNANGGKPLNGVTVSVGDSVYVTDTYQSLFHKHSNDPDKLSNGFYYLEGLPNGPAELIVQKEGFYSDTVSINVVDDNFTFTDVSLESSVPPKVISTSVGPDNEINPGETLIIDFSRGMNRASVDSALSFSPQASYSLHWASSKNTRLQITTDSLDFESNYTLTIDSTAFDNSSRGHLLDGNGDGTSGGSFTLNFDTGPEDLSPPVLTNLYPVISTPSELKPIINAAFDEKLDPSSIDGNTIQVLHGSYAVPGTVKYYEVDKKGVLNFFPSERLKKNTNYTLIFSKDISDVYGNNLGNNITRAFRTGDQEPTAEIVIDDFESGVGSWWDPSQSGSTSQYVAEETGREAETAKVNALTNSTQALRVNYGWITSVPSGHLIREHTPSKTPKFGNDLVIQSYVFGDGSGNKVRYVVRDSNGQLEASNWTTIDWMGWKLVSWDLQNDDVNAWAGGANGTIDGRAYFDSFQLTYVDGAAASGFVIFDDLKAVRMGLATSAEEEIADIPNSVTLEQNYPNPFNPSTKISFGLPQRSEVSIKIYDMLGREVATLYSGVKGQGFHTLNFDASALSSGMYLYRLVSDFGTISKKMTLLK